MIHTIENEYLKLSVKQAGAEICSIKSKKTDKEYIWDANPDIWGNHAPILFPIVGALKEGKYRYNGKEYSLPQHGFMRFNKHVLLTERSGLGINFLLKSDDESRKVYPFEFEFSTKYKLKGNRIYIGHCIYNPSDSELFFSVGTHPAFKCPINENENYDDYYLEFEKNENSMIYPIVDGLIGNKPKAFFTNNNKIELRKDLFNDNALVFKDLKSTSICLKSKKSAQFVKISFKGFPYMGIWAKPNAPFICIEPWLGIADSVDAGQKLESKEGIIKLKSKERFDAEYFIEINE